MNLFGPKVAVKKIMEIEPYVPGESKVRGRKRVIKLSSNENPFGPSPKAAAAIKKAASAASLYPDGGSNELRRAIAKAHRLDFDKIVCGAGSDELIALLCQAYAGKGDEVLYSQYGFLMYPISAKRAGATPVTAEEVDLRANIRNILDKVNRRTKIVFLANPNNPTGSYLTAEEIKYLRNNLPRNVLLVIDSAYAEYVMEGDYEAGAEIVEATDNTVMLRTFSKIYGLASLRLGWAYAPKEIVDVLNRVRGPFNVSGIGQAAGIAAVADTAHIKRSRKHNVDWLYKTKRRLSAIGLKCYPSVANFLLVEFPSEEGRTARDANEYLKARGIIGRAMTAYGLPACMRFTIGLDSDMRGLIATLKNFMKRKI